MLISQCSSRSAHLAVLISQWWYLVVSLCLSNVLLIPLRVVLLVGVAMWCGGPLHGDGPVVIQVSPSSADPFGGKPRGVVVTGQKSGQKPGKVPAGDAKKKPGEKPAADKSKTEGADSPEPKVIRRDSTTKGDADPDELKATVGEDGKVAFQFRNQPWVDLVQWLADISDQPLDWLELPADRVNLRSPGRYTVAQTRDLFNRYLLARGYTLLEMDGGLTVAKTENINPAIVPRVDVSSLASLAPHTYVRALLDVGWLSAEKLAEELKPMISSNGRLTALATTNRIEAMDAAVNLLQVAQLLQQERDSASREALAPEFKLRYLPAEEAKRLLEQFLGVDDKKSATAMSPQQMAMMAAMRNQGKSKTVAPVKKIEISIVANPRQNSVIIRAPADRVAVAEEFLKRIDVPSETIVSLADIQSRVQVFRLSSLDPEKLIEIVSEMNILEPTTRVRVDSDNNALIVSGSPADRFIINTLIERLDGSGRRFEVLQLRRLDAGAVAESIAFLMGQKDEDDSNKSRRQSYFYGYGYNSSKKEKKPSDEFRVSANSRYRQVLLWANEREMEEVRSLLIKLGELPPPGGSRRTIRLIDASATPETYEYLQRLRQQWSRLAPNPLELPEVDRFKEPNLIPRDKQDSESQTSEEESSEGDKSEAEGPEGNEGDKPEANKGDPAGDKKHGQGVDASDFAGSPQGDRYRLAVQRTPASDSDSSGLGPPDSDSAKAAKPSGESSGVGTPRLDSPIRSSRDFDRLFGDPAPTRRSATTPAPEKPHAPIRIELDSSGNLMLVSPDTDALDKLEQLMLQVAPPKRPYQVFHIQHASAFWMKLNLEDYFDDEDDSDESEEDSFYRYYFGSMGETDDSGPSGLGKGNRLRIVEDPDTNTLVISGATSEQLRTITELIELWDVPEPVNKRKARFTKLVFVKYGKAGKISETVKEAYRDLLSSNDKSFSGGKKGQAGRDGGGGSGGSGVAKSRGGSGSGLTDSGTGQGSGGADFSFKGKLSLGVDEIGNTLLVSAEGEPLLELVGDMIRQLDEAAQPQGHVEVMRLSGDISADALQRALRAMGVDAKNSATTPTPGANGAAAAARGRFGTGPAVKAFGN